jgi:DNA-binding NarL/FixJ family response regulator
MHTGEAARRDGRGPVPIRVFVLGKQRLTVETLGLFLESDPNLEVVGIQTDPALAAARVGKTRPDVLLLTYSLVHVDGVQVPAALRAECPDLKIIVLMPTLDESSLFDCIRAGAVGCLTDDNPASELITSIKRAHNGELLFAPDELVNLLTRRHHQEAHPRHVTQPLGRRELEVLQIVATGTSTEEAAARMGITVHTVRTHLKNALNKLQAHSKLEAVMVALKQGLIALPE